MPQRPGSLLHQDTAFTHEMGDEAGRFTKPRWPDCCYRQSSTMMQMSAAATDGA